MKTRIEDATTGWEWRMTLIPLQLLVVGEMPAVLVKAPHTDTLFLIDPVTILAASLTERRTKSRRPQS